MGIIEIFLKCSLSWEKLKEMKDKEIKFWAADGFNLLRIVEIDEKRRSFYMINQSGKITWPEPLPIVKTKYWGVYGA